MKVIGLGFNKIVGQKNNFINKELKINTGINISEIKILDNSEVKLKEEVLSINFDYTVEYKENIAKIELSGQILITLDSKKAKEILKEWKDKKIPEDFKIIIFNTILKKANIRAIQLEDELHLPIHISMPQVGTKKK